VKFKRRKISRKRNWDITERMASESKLACLVQAL